MNLYTINCGHFKLDGGAMFGVVPKSIWSGLNPADENNMCSWATRSLLIETGERLILVDCGMGDKQSEKFFGYYYLHGDDDLDKSLAQYGFHRGDITDVFLTHLHFDHCGGAIKREGDKLVPAFKNAVYWSNEAHWEWAIHPNPREKASFLKENILPIQESGQLRWIAAREEKASELATAPFLDQLDIRFANGHTEAMMLPQVNYKGKTIVFMADLLPSPGHIPLPYVMAYDTRPLMTMTEKEAFLQEALEKEYVLFFEHDPQQECCTLKETERGIRPDRFFKLSEL
ncbi:MBL fold metallo-hydrolase [Niabella drilacis]|uniref:Glyoxylase, beta-lactamase superfamily II n=1 Tax=Niabella drilacis (strain DSM 25811 / CCM 8410 / CCUG 62505 / LMG 26954 / E90) TaxID=1285928 RepID=A0A1G6YP26_NIADE|nr:MBL fold metallo-hydrolase [Niabella drilacis]SDD92148.1 Glyoxylase, beta-lactamase superfamily II [Niabella drilacis]